MVSIEREELLPMSINEIERIVIRHVSGSKANQIEQIPFVNLTEITSAAILRPT